MAHLPGVAHMRRAIVIRWVTGTEDRPVPGVVQGNFDLVALADGK
jgi:hypothetical protein